MTYHDLMRAWLDSGDPRKVAHARARLARPDADADAAPGPCPHRHPIAGCGCSHCGLRATRVTAAFCRDHCEEGRPPGQR